MSFTATRKLPGHFQSRTGERRSCCECRNWASVFYSGQVGVPEHNLYETPAPSWDTARLSSSKQESKEGLFIELPCKHIHASRGRFFFRWRKSCEETNSWNKVWVFSNTQFFTESLLTPKVLKKKKQILSICRLSAYVKHAKQRRGNLEDFIGKDVPKNENQVWLMRVAGLWSWVTSVYWTLFLYTNSHTEVLETFWNVGG